MYVYTSVHVVICTCHLYMWSSVHVVICTCHLYMWSSVHVVICTCHLYMSSVHVVICTCHLYMWSSVHVIILVCMASLGGHREGLPRRCQQGDQSVWQVQLNTALYGLQLTHPKGHTHIPTDTRWIFVGQCLQPLT